MNRKFITQKADMMNLDNMFCIVFRSVRGFLLYNIFPDAWGIILNLQFLLLWCEVT
jgi:hypothetical protein